MDAVTDSIAVLDVRILDTQISNESARELGPLKDMATLTGKPMETIVNWFMMLIIFVFDPLAIAMVVAANMAFSHVKGVARDPKDYEVYKSSLYTDEDEEEKPIEDKIFEESESLIPEMTELKLLRKQINHPRVQNAIKHAKRAGEWD